MEDASFVLAPVIVNSELSPNRRTAPEPVISSPAIVAFPFVSVVSITILPLEITFAPALLASNGLPILIPAEFTPFATTLMFVFPLKVAEASFPEI